MAAFLSDTGSDLVAAADKVRADARLITDPDQILGENQALLDVITTVQAALVRGVRESIHADATSVGAGRTTKAWLHEEMRQAGVDAGRYMRLARNLPFFAVTEAAFDAAEITIAHVAAILTALQSLPRHLRDTLEPHLVERARCYPPEEIAGFVDELLDSLGIDKVADIRRERRHAQRRIDMHKTLDGTRAVNANLNPEVGDAFDRALDRAGANTPCGPEDDRTPAQRMHDALGVMSNAYLVCAGHRRTTGRRRRTRFPTCRDRW